MYNMNCKILLLQYCVIGIYINYLRFYSFVNSISIVLSMTLTWFHTPEGCKDTGRTGLAFMIRAQLFKANDVVS